MTTKTEKLEARNYMLGQVSALEDLAAKYKTKAGQAFSLGQRNAADILLEIASEIEGDARVKRGQYQKLYHGKVA